MNVNINPGKKFVRFEDGPEIIRVSDPVTNTNPTEGFNKLINDITELTEHDTIRILNEVNLQTITGMVEDTQNVIDFCSKPNAHLLAVMRSLLQLHCDMSALQQSLPTRKHESTF